MNTSTSSVAKDAGDTSSTGRAYFNGRDRKNKYSSGQEPPTRIRKEREE